MNEVINTADLPPIKVAFVIDNIVVDILHTDQRMADIFLGNPIMLDITSSTENIQSGWNYNPETGQFSESAL
jgi:hypothetical protein